MARRDRADEDVCRPLAVIEGTGIVLKTKEDIEDWVANRRANWPTANRIVEKVGLNEPRETLLMNWISRSSKGRLQ